MCGTRHFQGTGLLQHCRDKGDDYHTATAFYLTTLFKNGMGLTQAAVHHGTNDQSRKTAEQISGCYYQSVDSQESDNPYQVNETIVDNACDTVGKGTSTLSGQELPGRRAHDNDGVNSVDKATDANGDPSKDSDHTINAENTTDDEPDCTLDSVEINTVGEANDTYGHPSQESMLQLMQRIATLMGLILLMTVPKTIDTNVKQTEPIVDFDVDCNDVSQKELPVQLAHENEEVNTVDKATDVNGDPSKDSDHTIDVENLTVDEPDHTLHSVEVNTVGKTNDTNGHPSHEYDVIVDAENSNIDGLDIITYSSKTIDTNVEQTEPIVDSVVDYNDVSAENMTVDEPDCIFDSVDVNTVAEKNDVHGLCIQEAGVQIDREDSNIDEPNIHDSPKTNDGNNEQTESIVDDDVEQNDVSQNIMQGLQNETVSKDVGMGTVDETNYVCGETTIIDLGNDLSIQGGVEMNNATPLQGSSVILGELNIVQGGVTFIQDLLTSVDFIHNEDQASNSEEFKWNDDGGDGSTDAKHIKKKSIKKFRIVAIEDDDDRSKVASLTTVVSLKYLQLNHKVNLNYHSFLDSLH